MYFQVSLRRSTFHRISISKSPVSETIRFRSRYSYFYVLDTDGRTKFTTNGKRLRPPLSLGDPKQFILSGSIGDRRVRVLVDTGATISFISKSLVPQLKPKPEVLRSELSIMMGTGETRDTDHYVNADLILNNTTLPAKFCVMPPSFTTTSQSLARCAD